MTRILGLRRSGIGRLLISEKTDVGQPDSNQHPRKVSLTIVPYNLWTMRSVIIFQHLIQFSARLCFTEEIRQEETIHRHTLSEKRP